MRLWSLLAIALTACMGDMGMDMMIPDVIDVPASAGRFDTVAAVDLDPAPTVVEVALTARVADVELAPGHVTSMWTYDGTLPGPRIEANVGDTVKVRFTNSLPEPTTIHWHGVRVPAAMDGVEATQAPIAPGATFTYEFVVPDAGTFWFHPHVRSDVQVERGLYGTLVVRGPGEPATTSDRVVVLDDLLIDDAWSVAEPDAMQAMVGRQGNLILANGRAHPIAAVIRGGLHRYRFVNAANARYFRLALPGHRLTVIGGDGGLVPAPREVDDVLLVPGQRVDLVVTATNVAGETLEWQSLPYDRGHGTGAKPAAIVFQQQNDDATPVTTPTVPSSLATIAPLPAPRVQRELRLAERGGHTPTFSINGETFPAITPLAARLGDVEEWSIVNTTAMDHPFHLHGFRFQLVRPTADVAWRDTINVPAGQTVVFRTRLEDHGGRWMFHCHILEHAERGMMGELEVAP